MQRTKLVIEYDGTNYSGFQIQPNKTTIQEVFEKTLSAFLGKKTKVFACGRTDAGVHALCQVLHFDSDTKIPPLMLMHEMNKLLPSSIAIVRAENVSKDFDARFSKSKKTYILKFYLSRFERPLFVNKKLRVNDNLNLQKMQEACNEFVGVHDFTSFVARKSGKTDFVREIFSAEIVKVGDCEFDFIISGNGFLYNMVRIIFGTILLAGAENIKTTDIKKIIESKNRCLAGKTVAPHGLYLADVKY